MDRLERNDKFLSHLIESFFLSKNLQSPSINVKNFTYNKIQIKKSKENMIFSLLLSFFLFLPKILADDYPNTFASAPLITIGTAISGSIEVSGDVDVFKIKFVAGRTYKITMQAISPPSPGFDDQLILYDSSGSQVDSDDDSIGKNAVISYTAPSTDYYYIKAKAYYSSGGTSTGTYAFAAVDTTSCSPKCTGNEIEALISIFT